MRLTNRQTKLWRLVKEHYQSNQFDDSHRIDRVERVLGWYEILLKHKSRVDPEILIPACICHDRTLPFVPDKEHARKAIDYARKVLGKAGYSDAEVTKIDQAMRQHSYEDKTTEQRTHEGNILYDADKLDSICLCQPQIEMSVF